MLQVPEIEIENRLRFDNPWWAERAVPQRFRDWPKRAYLRGFYDLAAKSSARRAVVLLGPRRVGKTVILHQAIQRLIDDGVAPTDILYVSVDTPVYSGLPLERLLTLFRSLHGHDADRRLFVFYDEIQYHPDWEVHLKSLVDSYVRYQFVVSGSAAAALRMKSHESGAGRFTDFLLPPLTFTEFLQFTGRPVEDPSAELFTDDAMSSLNVSFVDYLNYGGFPEAVLDDDVRRSMDRYIANDIIDKVLLRDLPSLYGIGDTAELNRLFTTIAYNTGNEVNLEELSKASGVAKNTLKKYLEYLEAAFLIHRLYRVDQNARHFKRATHFKIYLTNPCLRSALFGSVTADDDAMGRLVETALVSQLVHSAVVDSTFYARWPKGEVDLVFLAATTLKPVAAIEVKWSDRPKSNPDDELSSLFFFATVNGLEKVSVLTRTASDRVTRGSVTAFLLPAVLACAFGGRMIVDQTLAAGVHPRSMIRLGGEESHGNG